MKPFSVQLRFEGWTQSYHDFWVDADSEDLHEPGWCVANVHPLEPPGPARKSEACPVVSGCRGSGSVHSSGYSTHRSPQSCPYARHNVERILPRRVETRNARPWTDVHVGQKGITTGENTLRRAVHDSIFACLPPPTPAESGTQRRKLNGSTAVTEVTDYKIIKIS